MARERKKSAKQQAVDAALAEKADVWAGGASAGRKGSRAARQLLQAAAAGNLVNMTRLLATGVPVNARACSREDQGRTAFQTAVCPPASTCSPFFNLSLVGRPDGQCTHGHAEAARLLVQCGARTELGFTPNMHTFGAFDRGVPGAALSTGHEQVTGCAAARCPAVCAALSALALTGHAALRAELLATRPVTIADAGGRSLCRATQLLALAQVAAPSSQLYFCAFCLL